MDWTIFAIVVQLIFLEGILSIDNAAVLGAMVSVLPNEKNIDWPQALRGLGKLLDPLLGKERTAALRVGLLGAYLGRGIMLVLASIVIQNPWLKLIGAIYLVRLAFESLGVSDKNDADEQARELRARNFWLIVLNVELADLAFSLDNVVAAVSLSNKLWVVMLGVAIGILTMRFAAGLFSVAVLREPILKPAAYILVLNIGVQLLLEDLAHVHIADLTCFAISVSIILLALLYAHSKLLQKARPVLIRLGLFINILNHVLDIILIPVTRLFRLLLSGIRAIVNKISPQRANAPD